MMRLRLFSLLCLAAAGLFLSGCAHYRLGTGGKLGFTRLYIAPVANDVTALPQAVALVSTQVREAFLQDGRVILVTSPDDAEAVLTITLTRYAREVATVRPGDTGLARKFDLSLDASCTLRDVRSGKPLFENRPVASRRQSFTDDGQLQSEYQTLPLLAAQLSDRIAHAVLDVW